jgi:hypothetical protein
MCWTSPHTGEKIKTNKQTNHNTTCVGHQHTEDKRGRQTKQKMTTQYVLDTTTHKRKEEDKQNKKHNTICDGRHHAQDQRRRQAK